jgi:hypothetical protein
MDDGFLASIVTFLPVQSRWTADWICCCYHPCLSGPRCFLDRAGAISVQLLWGVDVGPGTIKGMCARGTVDGKRKETPPSVVVWVRSLISF